MDQNIAVFLIHDFVGTGEAVCVGQNQMNLCLKQPYTSNISKRSGFKCWFYQKFLNC